MTTAVEHIEHKGWCNANRSDDARGSMAVNVECNCGAETPVRDRWTPNRDRCTFASTGFGRFIKRCQLKHKLEAERALIRLYGQDGWAFTSAIRFQAAACDLAKTDESYYWSGYHLLYLIIDKARTDLTFLEAIEALAVAHLYGGLSRVDVTQQLKQMGAWP